MISRLHRFSGHNSLRFVYQKGAISRGPLFAVKYSKNPKRTTYRAAVVVSKKVDKSAVVRNRIRRRLFEAIRLQEKDIVEPYDIVITVFSAAVAEMSSEELQSQLLRQLKDASVVATRIR